MYITSFNKEDYISQSIESVLSQTLPPSEIIIIDDASSDNSPDIIRGYQGRYPNKIKAIFNDKNLGISKVRNIAINLCSNNVITFVDGDDFFFNKKLELEHSILKNKTSLGCIYSNHVVIDKKENEEGLFSINTDKPVQGEIFKENFSRSFNVSSGLNFHNEMFYKSCAEDIGLYDENIRIWEDWDFRIRMSKKYNYGYCPNVNSAYRKLESGLHQSNIEIHYREQIKIYKKNKNLMNDIDQIDKNFINNKLYAKLKVLFIIISQNSLKSKRYFQFVIGFIEFLSIFRMKKAIKYIFYNI